MQYVNKRKHLQLINLHGAKLTANCPIEATFLPLLFRNMLEMFFFVKQKLGIFENLISHSCAHNFIIFRLQLKVGFVLY